MRISDWSSDVCSSDLFPLRFGGKIGPASGQPVDALVEVTAVRRDCWQSFGPTQVPLGACAAIRIRGVDVVLISNRTQARGLELFRHLGLAPMARKMSVGKPTTHLFTAFAAYPLTVITL